MKLSEKHYDVLIIGAGIIGTLTARELSRYELNVCIVEKESDIAMGATKANSAIVHAGFDPEPGSLKAILNVRGNAMMEGLCKELDVPFRRNGSIVIAFEEECKENGHSDRLVALYERGIVNGVPGLKILNRDEVRRLEPELSHEVMEALYAPSAGIVCPYELAVAAAENACENGADIYTDCEVIGIQENSRTNEGFSVETGRGVLTARVIINAAGLYSDEIARLADDGFFSINPRKGEYLLLDKSSGGKANTVIFQLPTRYGKGILVSQTVHGNLLLGPTAVDTSSKEDTSITSESISKIRKEALRMVPTLDMGEIITSFAGIRAVPSTGDFIIKASDRVKGFIHAAGIESPGLTAAPAIAVYIKGILEEMDFELIPKKGFKPSREHVFRFREADEEEKIKMIEKNAAYGRIICRCEKVTEGEILDAIRRCPGTATLDAVKRRTRSGMGRCQGGFCTPRIIDILARELNVEPLELTKNGGDSRLLTNRTK